VKDTTVEVWNRIFEVYWPIGLGVLLIVTVLVVAFVLRWRARPGDEDEFPGGTDEKTPVEVVYAIGLALLAAFLLALTLDGNSDLEAKFDQPADVRVEVTGARWNWRFVYPDLGIVEQGTRDRIPTLKVPAGEPVAFTGTSIDVIHSFWIPDERFKRDVFPHRDTTWQMTFPEVRFESGAGRCAEFCGLRHSDMRFNVDVVSPAEFDSWAAADGGAAKDGAS
jgi:cytochrome c oxidase subunit 2